MTCRCDTLGSACPDPICQTRYKSSGRPVSEPGSLSPGPTLELGVDAGRREGVTRPGPFDLPVMDPAGCLFVGES